MISATVFIKITSYDYENHCNTWAEIRRWLNENVGPRTWFRDRISGEFPWAASLPEEPFDLERRTAFYFHRAADATLFALRWA